MASEASSIRVLHVDDEPEFTELTAEFLRRTDDRFEVVTANDAQTGLSYLEDEAVDCIVSDQDMPGMDGLEFLETVRESHPDLPFILFTGKGSEEIASEAITAGVSDYLRKGTGSEQYDLLANRIENAVEGYLASRRAEEEQRRLRQLAENARDALWIYDGDWSELEFVNSAYEEVWGQPTDELREDPEKFLEATHPEDRETVEEAMAQLSNGEAVDIEVRVGGDLDETAHAPTTPEGYHWAWIQAQPIVEDGEVVRLVGFTRDITDRRERERELEQYKRIVDAMGDGVYAVDENGQYIDINEYLEELSGYEEREWRDSDPSQFLDQEDVERFESAIADLLSEAADGVRGGVRTVEATLHTADGEQIPIEANVTPLPTESGEFRGTVGVVRDITERKERERELEQYETIVTAIPDEVYTIDEEGYFTSLIPPTGKETATTGYDPDELVGEHVSTVMDEADIERGERLIRDLLADPDRERGSFEIELVAKDGTRIPNENHIALLPMDDGEFRGTVGVLRDISERRERERALKRQNERLEEFVGVVSHDLRNPLNVAQNRLEIAREECDSEHLDNVDRAHDRMATLIDDLLTLAREGETVNDREPVALDDIVTACWRNVATGSASLDVETGLRIRADRSRLQQLLENLMGNAVEHAGPAVQVTVGSLPDGFYVADDGPGIPPEDRERVFESGYSTAADGTGFGLRIVEEIADAHGWTVTVTESEAGGARFEVTGVQAAD